jgi:hypothetical protein
MKLVKLFGNRVLVQRMEFAVDGNHKILIPTAVSNAMERKEGTFDAEIVMVGNGKQIAENRPELVKGAKISVDNRMGTLQLRDGTEIVSDQDVVGLVGE